MLKLMLTKKDWGISATYTYNKDGVCVKVELPEKLEQTQAKGFFTVAQMNANEMKMRLKSENTCEVVDIPSDLSFEGFWNAYFYKVGSKGKAEGFWRKLSESDKISAINKIKEYDRYIVRTGVAKVYPERYLSQRRWENEFK